MSEEALVARRSGRLDVVLADLLPELSRSRLASLVRDGCVHVEGRQVTRPSEKIREGQAIHVRIPDPAPAAAVGALGLIVVVVPKVGPGRSRWEQPQERERGR